MEIVFDTSRLMLLIKDFYSISHIRTGVYDIEQNEIVAWPNRQSGFCTMIRSTGEGLSRCRECDRNAFIRALSIRYEAHAYRCHAGLTEATTAIIDNGTAIGYLMIGQIRSENSAEQWDRTAAALFDLNLDNAKLKEEYFKLPYIGYEKILSYARVLRACALSVWLEKFVSIQSESLYKRLEYLIDNSLNRNLTLEYLSEQLGVGKTTLCKCAMARFGVTVNKIIRGKRVEAAKVLLERTDKSIADIAEAVGIEDYNYFTKVFKSEAGMTPSAYRKVWRYGARAGVK